MRVHARLVILDYKMPRLDGFGACAQIRHLPGYGDTPIAMLTAFDNQDTRAAAERAGVTMVLAKPFKPVDLLRSIAVLLGSAPADGGRAPEPVGLVWTSITLCRLDQELEALLHAPAECAFWRV
jgi:DNA-binding response OmpR family regulator